MLNATAVTSASIALAVEGRDWRMLPWGPLVFLAIHAGAGVGILAEWLKPGTPPPAVKRSQASLPRNRAA